MKDLIGKIYGKLKVISAFKSSNGLRCICLCECGNEASVMQCELKLRTSCGCRLNTRKANGLGASAEYGCWKSMMNRCYDVNHSANKNYMGRGISVCKEWHSFDVFYSDMGQKPKGKTLDRIDNNKGYSKDNCRWATYTEQIRNRRNSVYLEIDGVQKPMPEWCEIYNVNWFTIRDRLKKGMSPKEAFATPIGVKTEPLFLTLNNVTLSAVEWSKKLGINKRRILSRKRLGWSDEDILTIDKIPAGCKKKYLYGN